MAKTRVSVEGRSGAVGRALPQLVVVTGKGGVGKTTVAALVGSVLARGGRRVLVLEVDPRESLHLAFAAAPSGGAVVPAEPRLAFQNLQPRAVLDALVRERLKIGMLVRRTLKSPIYEHFVEGAPGLRELAILGHALRVLRAGEAETVVLDAPATGHGLALLRAPTLVSKVIGKGPIGALAGELATFVSDGSACRVAVVTRPEELPLQESLELIAELRELGLAPAFLVANGVVPALSTADARRAERDGDAIDVLWRERRALAERVLARLAGGPLAEAGGVEIPVLRLPLLPHALGPALLRGLGAPWAEEWDALSEKPWG